VQYVTAGEARCTGAPSLSADGKVIIAEGSGSNLFRLDLQ
jgi:hypothetical protein